MKTFNEFQKELQRRINDPQQVFVLTYLYEVLVEHNKQIEMLATILTQQAEALHKIALLRVEDVEQIKKLTRKVEGVDVESVAFDPETEH